MPDFKINDEYSPFNAMECTKKAVAKTKELTATKSKDEKATATLAAVNPLFQQICKSLGYTDEELQNADEDIRTKVAAHKKKKQEARQSIKADDEEKLALAETLAAIAQALMANWSSKSASEKQAALDQIAALKAQIGDISSIASDEIKEELEGIAAGVENKLKELPKDAPEAPDDASSAMSIDDDEDVASSRASETGGNDSDPLNKPNAQYTLYSDTTGVRMGVRVKDGKTKIRIPHTEGLTQDEKVRLAHDLVKAAIMEGAYKLKDGIPTFTLKTQDPQFHKAVYAQIKLLGFECNPPAGYNPEGKTAKKVREYNEEVLSEHMPAHTFTDEKEKEKYLANRPATDFQFALFNSLLTPKTEERAKADLKAAAPFSLLKYLYHDRAETGALRIAKFRSGSAMSTVSPDDLTAAKKSVKEGFVACNYLAHTPTDLSEHINELRSILEPVPPTKQTPSTGSLPGLNAILRGFSEISVERAKAAAEPARPTPSQS